MTGRRGLRPLSSVATPTAIPSLRTLARLAVPVTALAVLAAPAAQAATWTHTDATGDTRIIERNVGDPTRNSGYFSDSRERHGDLTRLTVRHGADNVRVAAVVRDEASTVLVTLATSRGETFRAVRDTDQEGADRVRLVRDGRAVACDGLRINRTSSGYLATVPRACLGTPYRVRVGLQTQAVTAAGTADDVSRYIDDDALRPGRLDRYAPRLSPWVVADRAPQRTGTSQRTVSARPAPVTARAASTVTIRPERLPRGAEVEGAHMASPTSRTIVDGDRRVTVDGTYVDLLGKVGTSYVVRVLRDNGWSVLRVGRGGSERTVAEDVDFGAVLSRNDGRPLLAVTRSAGTRGTSIEVYVVTTGSTFRRRTFASSLRVLDVQGDQARLIMSSDAGTYDWDLPSNDVTVLTRRIYGAADLDANRLATLTGDPYDGGCTVVSTITRPQVALWRTCSERVDSFSPDGQRMATIHILSDGPGPNQVWSRSLRGSLLASYKTDRYFGEIRWESAKALLLDTYGSGGTATVRCVGSSCVRATALVATPDNP